MGQYFYTLPKVKVLEWASNLCQILIDLFKFIFNTNIDLIIKSLFLDFGFCSNIFQNINIKFHLIFLKVLKQNLYVYITFFLSSLKDLLNL